MSMKVFGKFIGGYNARNFAVGGMVAFNVDWVNVETYSERSVKKDDRCFLTLGTNCLVTTIRPIDCEYMSAEKANALVRDIATNNEAVELDAYGMGFFDIFDIRPESIRITNDIDEDDYTIIPLQVELSKGE